MFCVILKVKTWMGWKTTIVGPYHSRRAARAAMKELVPAQMSEGRKREDISVEVKEMVKF